MSMYVCHDHDIAFSGYNCPACELEDKIAEWSAYAKDLVHQIEALGLDPDVDPPEED
jgi:hypothetical protein